MEKKCKIVLLPTDKPTKIHKNNLGNLYYTPNKSSSVVSDDFHLYILSDNEIKEGDWAVEVASAYPTGLAPLLKCHKRIADEMQIKEGWRRVIKMPATGVEMMKVIATTNPDLIKEDIASIDNEFIKEYCNNPVDGVIVEYTIYNKEMICPKTDTEKGFPIENVKISSNGSIIIKSVEETWDDIFEKLPINPKSYLNWLKQNYEVPKKKL